jgi:hypothetical protein
MPGDISPRCDPYTFLLRDTVPGKKNVSRHSERFTAASGRFCSDILLHELPQRLATAGLPDDPRVERDVHYLATFPIQHVERVLEIVLVGLAHRAPESRRHVELAVITVVLPPRTWSVFSRISIFGHRMKGAVGGLHYTG